MDFKRCFLVTLIVSFSTVLLLLVNTQVGDVIQLRNYSAQYPLSWTANRFHEPLPRVVGSQNRTITATPSTSRKVINDTKQKENSLRTSPPTHSTRSATTTTSVTTTPTTTTTNTTTSVTTTPTTTTTTTLATTSATTPTTTTTTASRSTTTITTTTSATTSPTTTLKAVPKKVYYICTSFTGGIGNQMFEFATGFGTAFSKNMKMVIGVNDLINKVFELKSNTYLVVSKDRRECSGARSRGEARASAYDKNLVNFKVDASYHLGLYLQSWEYFNKSTTELKKQLIFREPTRTQVKQKIESLVKSHKYTSRADVVLIAMHVRRGDMVNNNFGYAVATREYLENAMSYFTNISNKIFVVCSNDMGWVKANIPKDKGSIEFMTGNSREVDMGIMASCDHMIMSVGSFSWWSGWFINGKVLYYKWPAKEGSNLRRQYSETYHDYFYPNWIGL